MVAFDRFVNPVFKISVHWNETIACRIKPNYNTHSINHSDARSVIHLRQWTLLDAMVLNAKQLYSFYLHITYIMISMQAVYHNI